MTQVPRVGDQSSSSHMCVVCTGLQKTVCSHPYSEEASRARSPVSGLVGFRPAYPCQQSTHMQESQCPCDTGMPLSKMATSYTPFGIHDGDAPRLWEYSDQSVGKMLGHTFRANKKSKTRGWRDRDREYLHKNAGKEH